MSLPVFFPISQTIISALQAQKRQFNCKKARFSEQATWNKEATQYNTRNIAAKLPVAQVRSVYCMPFATMAMLGQKHSS